MARIRSVHPGLLTDEAFMTLTVEAPLAVPLLLGLWMEADDQGVFEWKPLTLKARILPAVAADIGLLLEELIRNRFVTRFSEAGREYGAIRNFRRYQKPKKPNKVHPLPTTMEEYVGSGSPPVPHQFPTGGKNPPLMEDGGWKREEEEETTLPVSGETVGADESDLSGGEAEPIRLARHSEAYPEEFERLWTEYKILRVPNASKHHACRAYQRLPGTDKEACFEGLVSYVLWLQDERRKKPDKPAKHLATFINERAWEPFMELQAERTGTEAWNH